MKSSAYYIKFSILSVLLLIESLALSTLIKSIVYSINFIIPSTNFILLTGMLLILIMYTISLTVGGWDKYEQYLFIPIPLALSVGLVAAELNIIYGLILFVISLLDIILEIMAAARIKQLLIKFDAPTILGGAAKRAMVIFSILGSVLVLSSPASQNLYAVVSSKITDTAGFQAQKYLNYITPQANSPEMQTLNNYGIDASQLQNLNLYNNSEALKSAQIGIKTNIQQQIDKYLKPYQNYVPYLLALIIFGTMQFIIGVSGFVYKLTINPIFALAKKTRFLNVETIQVQKETLIF